MERGDYSPDNENGAEQVEPSKMQKIVKLIFPRELPDAESLREKYPKRELPEGAMVTRLAPSPTGFMHLGGLYMGLISERFAHQSNGVFYLRIEDTDKKREVEGAKKIITDTLHNFGLDPDEGESFDGGEIGEYGPYSQSERKEIYQIFIKKLLEQGDAYPCFCTEEELNQMRKMQEDLKIRPGYYGPWAKWRDADSQRVIEELQSNTPFVIRLKSEGNYNETFVHHDLIKGDLRLPENDIDVVIMKSDGLPTYHLAHAVDDDLMQTSHVLRGDEWISSVPLHRELFDKLGFKHPRYAHVAPINKIDESGNKRKLSKRKDPEANVLFYNQKGYPEVAVIEYLMNLANSGFEDWRRENPDRSYKEFQFTFEKLPTSAGPLFSEAKLNDIAKDMIARMNPEEVYAKVLEWSKAHDRKFYEKLNEGKEYWISVFAIERGGQNPRKDISCWSEVSSNFNYFDTTEELNPAWESFSSVLNGSEIRTILEHYSAIFNINDSKDEWFSKIKQIAIDYNFAPDIKTYKSGKDKYRGHVGEIGQIIRCAITGRKQSPDLHEVMRVLGDYECKKRLTPTA